MLWNVQHVRHQRQGGLNILNDFFFPSPVDPWRNWKRPLPVSPVSVVATLRGIGSTIMGVALMIGMLVTPYAEDAFGQLGIAMAFFGYAPKKAKKRLVSIPKIAKICQNLGFLMGFCMFLTKKTKTCPLHPHGSLLQEISNFSDGTRNQGISESTLQLQWGLVAALLIGIVGLSRHQNFSTKFSKRWRTQHSHHTTLDDGEGADSDDHSFARRVSWEYRNIPKPSIFPQKRREFVCLKTGNHHAKSSCPSQIARWATRVKTRFPSGYQDVQSQIPPDPPDHSGKTLWAEVGENVTIFSADSNYESNLYYYEVDFKCHSFGKNGIAPTKKKIDACPGSFLVREAARAEGLCCRDASTLDKLSILCFWRKENWTRLTVELAMQEKNNVVTGC